MSRAEFVDRNLPIIINEHRQASRAVNMFKDQMIPMKKPKYKKLQDDKLEFLRNRRDTFLILKERLMKEKEMWDEYRRTRPVAEG